MAHKNFTSLQRSIAALIGLSPLITTASFTPPAEAIPAYAPVLDDTRQDQGQGDSTPKKERVQFDMKAYETHLVNDDALHPLYATTVLPRIVTDKNDDKKVVLTEFVAIKDMRISSTNPIYMVEKRTFNIGHTRPISVDTTMIDKETYDMVINPLFKETDLVPDLFG